ncbi:MAG: hypothetical protein M3380_18060 [Chloroflexota bacterium]|nr:hypothetical protein [Chloroflexota bacterium]
MRRGVDPDLVVCLPDGTPAAIAMSLTDYAAAPGADRPVPAAHLLELGGLQQVLQLVERLRADGRLPTPDARYD